MELSNGIVNLDCGIKLYKDLPMEGVLQSEKIKILKSRDHGNGYANCIFKETFCHRTLHFQLYFYQNQLNSVFFSLATPNGSSWDDWSEEKEKEINVENMTFLESILGTPHSFISNDKVSYRYPWGSIWCGIDSKTCCAGIKLQYETL
jgi:hypothetical protein